ncbi:hypothetical protein [Hydrogenimonas sp.]
MDKLKTLLFMVLVSSMSLLFSTGCGTGSSENEAGSGSSFAPPVPASGSLEALDDDSFNRLSENDKIYVANKLYNTLYKGKSLGEIKGEVATGSFISDFRNTLYSKSVQQPDLDKIVKDTYVIPLGKRFGDPLSEKFNSIYTEIASTLYYTKLSRSYYDEWMTYVLNQTILFSPAWEVESVHPFPELIRSNYDRIKREIAADHSVKTIAYNHMVSKENWARFRSPEDNGREMLEIWLYDFNDLHVPLAARALRNWKWVVKYEAVSDTINDSVYYFYNDTNNADEMNTEAIDLLGTTITTGEDFYKAVVDHEDFLPGVVMRLVNLFFPDFTESRRQEIVDAIMETKPTTFREIFDQIIFSRTYLFESTRVKSYEEIFMGLSQKLGIEPPGEIFNVFHATGRGVEQGGLAISKQRAFTYKLGRSDRVPSDSDSIIRLHQNIRAAVFLNRRGDKGWSSGLLWPRYDSSTLKSFLNGMFLDIVGRSMTPDEEETLAAIAKDAGIEDPNAHSGWNRLPLTLMTFDYFSRLSEIYIYRKVEPQGDAS